MSPEVRFNLLSDERDLARLEYGIRLCLEILSDPRMAAFRNELFLPKSALVQSLWHRSAKNWFLTAAIVFAFESQAVRAMLLEQFKLDPQALLSDPVAIRQLALQRAAPPHHASGTCRMGCGDNANAVVDPHCQVRGISNLQVIDASIMPTLVRANTHLPVLMIAEKMADHILGGLSQARLCN
jgi:5-(hydroxymethyl)furfural/furfural oxidase